MRSRVRRASAFGFLLFALSATTAAAHMEGTWSGTLTINGTCDDGSKVQWSSPTTLQLLESGDDFSGNMRVDKAPHNPCADTSSFVAILPISGTSTSATAFSATVITPEGHRFPVSGTVSGDTMEFGWSGDGYTAKATLTRTSSESPDGPLTGSWSFTVNVSRACNNGSFNIAFGGPGSLTHTGSDVTGSFDVTQSRNLEDDPSTGNCFYKDVNDKFVALLSAQISGNTISGVITSLADEGSDGQDDEPGQYPFTGTISGDVITLELTDETPETVIVTLTRTSSTPAPAVSSFIAEPALITAGQPATLRWSTTNATSVMIDNGVGSQPTSGSVTVTPAATTTYTLTATGPGGSATASATVNVSSTPLARVAVSALPRGMVQVAGGPVASDSFTVTNYGGASTDITLSQTGSFFTQSPTTFALAPGASQTVTITAGAEQTGVHEAVAVLSGNGVPPGLVVPVRLLVDTIPSGTVAPRATSTRSVVEGSAGDAVSGSAEFTNTGTATMRGIAVSDAEWLTPQQGIITIAPGQNTPISFTIDPAKRPDRSYVIGGMVANLSVRFLHGSSNSARFGTNNTSGTTGSVSVSIVHVVKPGTEAAAPPPLAAGEFGWIVPGMGALTRATGDLALMFRSNTATIPDLKIFHAPSGTTTFLSSTFSQLPANSTIAFPALSRSIFGNSAATGSVHLRSSEISKVSVAATRLNTSSSSGTYGGALPLLRTDVGAAQGESVIIPGIGRAAGIETTIYLQELSNATSNVRIEFLGAGGNVVSSLAQQSLGAFGSLELVDAIPQGATAVRITNESASRVAAYALLEASDTGDAWYSDDPGVGGAGTLIVPIVSAGEGAESVLHLTNRTGSRLTATVNIVASAARRRSVRTGTRAGGNSLRSDGVTTLDLEPFASTSLPLPVASGYARIEAPSGSVTAAARSVVSSATGRAVPFGTTLPVVPLTIALAAGESKSFTNFEDTSAATRARSTPGTFRTHLILLESGGGDAVVRLTLRYIFSAGAATSTPVSSSREYTIRANQQLTIKDIATAIIGDVRDNYGDMRGLQLDVEVVSGSGRVLPFLVTIDNGSADMDVRRD